MTNQDTSARFAASSLVFHKDSRMYVVLLRFSANKAKAPEYMAAHREWIEKGVGCLCAEHPA